jgi:hypothetical protein
LYNAAVQERREAYRMGGISIGRKEQSSQLPEIKNERPALARVYSQVIQETLKRVDLTYENDSHNFLHFSNLTCYLTKPFQQWPV